MRSVVRFVVFGLGAALAAAACAKGANDVGEGEGGGGSDSGGSSGPAATSSGSSTGVTSGSASTTGSGSTTGASSGSAVGSSSAASSGSAGTSSGAGGGAACTPVGDLSVMGTTGACNANQNCPTTSFTAVVTGAPGPIVDVDVSLNAIAASTDQNILSLRSPQGTTVTLFNHHGSFLTDDFFGTMFDDEASQSVATAPGPFHGCYKPDQALSAFQGQTADGVWTLQVQTCLYETSVSNWTLHLDF